MAVEIVSEFWKAAHENELRFISFSVHDPRCFITGMHEIPPAGRMWSGPYPFDSDLFSTSLEWYVEASLKNEVVFDFLRSLQIPATVKPGDKVRFKLDGKIYNGVVDRLVNDENSWGIGVNYSSSEGLTDFILLSPEKIV
ncbi:hypothetical protein [Coprobacter tertius]|uniref:Uncharacterized protein n=1 Tax=Coprobacter tertius TaxID=2944915 RepID=A0ABT1MK13_9BACT|nr:hypothetical protein [Coprobacter tertius]MCP9612952.1 hypothetical protein [Coprobacter tertius]